MATNNKQTSARVASTAGKTLGSPSASALQKSLAGSALRPPVPLEASPLASRIASA